MGIFDWLGTSSSSSTTNQSQNPWAPAQPALNSILGGVAGMANNTSLTGAETGALGQLQGNANAGNPYAAAIGNYATNMLGGGGANNGAPMVNDAYSTYTKAMNPTASGQYLDPNTNPFFAATTNALGNDAWNRISGLYAGSGRDPAGAGNFGYNVSRGIGDATAPVYAQQYQNERANQLNAINGMYGAGNTTAGILGNFQNQSNQNQGTGVTAADSALAAQNAPAQQTLAIEAARRGIPISLMQQLAGMVTPIAGLGGTSSSTTNGTQTASPAASLGALGNLGNLGKLWGK